MDRYDPYTDKFVRDTIDRQAAIDALSQYPFEKVVNCVSIIEELPPAQPEQRWIPCSERLPEEKMNPNTSDFELVICTTTFGDVRAYRFGTPIGWNEPHFWNGIGIMDGYVLAWMYLPEPYKGGEQDG